jgi:ABC-type transport system involved in multi-copper enzyme maturation permease subunit
MAGELLGKLPVPWAGLQGLVGPLVGKELRVASRRPRSYGLRFAYVLILLVFIVAVWIPTVSWPRSMAVSRAQMDLAAKTITVWIMGFQFLAAQLVALVIMSAAISEEVYGRTLGVLMMTPLSSRQVVVSKLFSRLGQILLLVATSLPPLAIVRILGGIPWSYLIGSLGLTLATVVFVGSVSLFFSSLCRRAHMAVIASILALVLLFMLPLLLGAVLVGDFPSVQRLYTISWLRSSPAERLFTILLHGNPYLLLYRFTDLTVTPRGRALSLVPPMIFCCVSLLGTAALLLAATVRLVRSVALRRAMGEPAPLDILHRRDFEELRRAMGERAPLDLLKRRNYEPRNDGQAVRCETRAIRRVVGPAMIWKEMVCPLSHREKLASGFAIGVEVLLLFIAWSFPPLMAAIGYEATHLLYLWTFLSLGILFTITASATVISAERERGSWPVLLVTPLTNRDILLGKLVGVLRRCGPIWLPLPAYLVAFTCAGIFHSWAVVQGTLILLAVVLFLAATGFYFSGRFGKTTDAVTANLILIGALWCVLPATIGLLLMVSRVRGETADFLLFAGVPFAQAFALMATTLDGFTGDTVIRCFHYQLGAPGYTALLFLATLAYGLVSLALLWRTVRAFRRRIV